MTSTAWYDLRNAIWAEDFGEARKLLDLDLALIDETNGIGETILHFLAVENDQRGWHG